MRTLLAAAIVCLSVIGISHASDAQAAIRRPTNIPAQDLETALQSFAKEREVQIIFRSTLVKEFRTAGVRGELNVNEALDRLLGGTGLTYRYLDDRTITILPLAAPSAQSDGNDAGDERLVAANNDARSHRMRLTQSTGSRQGVAAAGGAEQTNERDTADNARRDVQEIVVTAQKREERLQDVPVPVVAINTQALAASNQLRLQDYYATVPGLQISPGRFSSRGIAIRGITTGGLTDNPTVGVTIDDMPYGSSTGWGSGQTLPDIDPGDLARIEVLRGPQGTLYGASSMGGLIKFVTVDPSTDGVSGRVEVGTSSAHSGSSLGYSVRGSINLPLGETFAARASAFSRQDPGYVDNPVWGIEGLNKARVMGGRVAALWKSSDSLSLKLSASAQQDRGDGSTEVVVGPGLSGLQQDFLPGVGEYVRKAQIFGATLQAKLGNAELVSISGYNINTANNSTDFTNLIGSFTALVFPGVTGTPIQYRLQNKKFTQEIRLTAPLGQRADWLLGAFYTREKAHWIQHLLAQDTTTGQIVGPTLDPDIPTSFTEYAAFADLSLHLSERFDVQVGGRHSQIRQTYQNNVEGPLTPIFYGVPSLIGPVERTNLNAFTYLLTPRFRISSDLMAYARLASGYRAGGTNSTAAQLGGVAPSHFDPDETRNYEVGLKGDFLDRRLVVDASLYYIDWKSIQLGLVNQQTFAGYIDNAGKAKSQGIELSVETRPATGLTISGWVAWSDAHITEDFPGGNGFSGDRMPYNPRISGNLAMEQRFPLSSRMMASVGGRVSYVGDRDGAFNLPGARTEAPAYTRVDLHAGIDLNSWTANLFINNVGDERGVLTAAGDNYPPAFYYIEPRMIGVSLTRTF